MSRRTCYRDLNEKLLKTVLNPNQSNQIMLLSTNCWVACLGRHISITSPLSVYLSIMFSHIEFDVLAGVPCVSMNTSFICDFIDNLKWI